MYVHACTQVCTSTKLPWCSQRDQRTTCGSLSFPSTTQVWTPLSPTSFLVCFLVNITALCSSVIPLLIYTYSKWTFIFFYHCMVFCCMAKAQFIFLLLMGGQPFRTLIELLLFIHKCFKNIFIFWNLNIIISFFPIPSHFFLYTQTCLGHLMLSIYMWF